MTELGSLILTLPALFVQVLHPPEAPNEVDTTLGRSGSIIMRQPFKLEQSGLHDSTQGLSKGGEHSKANSKLRGTNDKMDLPPIIPGSISITSRQAICSLVNHVFLQCESHAASIQHPFPSRVTTLLVAALTEAHHVRFL
jgi:hypothetical protein